MKDIIAFLVALWFASITFLVCIGIGLTLEWDTQQAEAVGVVLAFFTMRDITRSWDRFKREGK